MEGLMKRWCRTCGTLMLLAAIVLSCAWAKSCFDNASESDPANPGPFKLSGRIGIFGDRNPIESDGVPPQIQWHIAGFFTPATIRFAPKPATPTSQVTSDTVPLFQVPSTTRPGEESPESAESIEGPVNPAGYSDNRDVKQAAANIIPAHQYDAGAADLPRPQGSFQVGDAATFDDPSFDDEETSRFEWERFGLMFCEFEYADGRWDTGLVIPHWMIVTPLLVLSGTFFVIAWKRPGWGTANVQSAAGTTNTSSGARSIGIGGFLTSWRRKLGLVTVLLSLALTMGWLRSRAVSDMLAMPYRATQNLLISGVEGLVLKSWTLDEDADAKFYYRTKTGDAHRQMRFRPMEVEELMAAASAAAGAPALNVSEFGSAVLPSAAEPSVILPAGTREQTQQAFIPETSVNDAAQPPQTSSTAGTGIEVSGGRPWFGVSFNWAGIYINVSSSPQDVMMIIPYGFLTIPCTLLSAFLLLWSRARRLTGVPSFADGAPDRN